MTYHELFAYIREKFIDKDVSDFKSDAAYQFNVRGEGEGAFYVAVKNNVLSIEPYEYYDRDVIFELDSKVLIDIADGKIKPVSAFMTGKLKAHGDKVKALEFEKILKAENKTKTAEPVAAEPAKKPEKEKETVAAAAVKTEAKKTAAKTTVSAPAKKNTRKKK
ncbi:MAG TPA: hypothetical protein DIW26_02885 [Ruminococcus sp.]|nr:hypothetical protein [Ruminococcus sp.]